MLAQKAYTVLYVYALNLGGTGIRPPDSFSFRSRCYKSGDIFYCSGSRQLNHFSLFWNGDERLRFRGQKVKGHGHSGIKYAGNSTLHTVLDVLHRDQCFYARQHVCYSAYMLSPFRPSVRHTG